MSIVFVFTFLKRWSCVFFYPKKVEFLSSSFCVFFFSLFKKVDYPVAWVEGHARAFSDQVERLARVLDVYTERLEEGANFRSSLLKKEPLLQYVATNLHIQVGGFVRGPVRDNLQFTGWVGRGVQVRNATPCKYISGNYASSPQIIFYYFCGLFLCFVLDCECKFIVKYINSCVLPQ